MTDTLGSKHDKQDDLRCCSSFCVSWLFDLSPRYRKPTNSLRSPISWPRNGPIDVADRGTLNCAAQAVVNGRNRDVAWNQSHSNASCKDPIFAQTNPFDTFDTFQDLCGSDSQTYIVNHHAGAARLSQTRYCCRKPAGRGPPRRPTAGISRKMSRATPSSVTRGRVPFML
jgi:hypothetical protein